MKSSQHEGLQLNGFNRVSYKHTQALEVNKESKVLGINTALEDVYLYLDIHSLINGDSASMSSKKVIDKSLLLLTQIMN